MFRAYVPPRWFLFFIKNQNVSCANFDVFVPSFNKLLILASRVTLWYVHTSYCTICADISY